MTRSMRLTNDTMRRAIAPRVRAARRCAVALLMAGLCSCSSSSPLREMAGVDPFQHEAPLPPATASPSSPPSTKAVGDHSIEQVAFLGNAGLKVDARQTGVPQHQFVHNSQAVSLPSTAALRSAAAKFTPADPRIAISADDRVEHASREFVTVPHGMGPFIRREPLPDEFLFDGGDRGLPLHYDPYTRHGLETEDTIAEYRDHLGRDHVKPSNRVAIYSPRFGAVRTVSGPQSGVSIDRLALTEDTSQAVGMRNLASTLDHSQRETSEGVLVRSRASGLEVGEGEITFEQRQYVTEHQRLLNAFQGIRYGNFDQLLQIDKAQLAYRIEAAVVWTRDQFPVVTAGLRAGQEVQARFKVQELIGAEDERRVPGRLQIVKLADRKIAVPGEVVTFTIRYDNLGERELTEVRIVDNLTPRLEYLVDSAQSDRPGRFFADDNHEGSVILHFELNGELPGHTGGTISFQARVR